jgi:uncharacterized MAPEG superfamily protein
MSSANPAFVAYAITAVVLIVNLIFLWSLSGVTRGRTGKVPNAEDVAAFKAELSDIDPPGVARVLRAHANAGATIYPFLFLGLIYVMAGGSNTVATAIFATFAVARWLHSIFYLSARQPWRTIAFTVSGLALLALLIAVIVCLVRG